MVQIVFRANDNVIELDGLKNKVADTFLNSATVTVTIVDKGGVEVTGQTWPLAMDYVASSDGIYRGTIEDVAVFLLFTAPTAFQQTQGSNYTAQVTANGGTDLQGYWEIPLQAKNRIS